MILVPRKEYPRPDFERKQWQTLNGEWEFLFDEKNEIEDKQKFFSCEYTHKIIVPFCYQSSLSEIGEKRDCDVVWYRRSFEIQHDTLENRSLLLNFGAVDYEAKVWLNGEYLGKHEGGHTPFSFNISHVVRDGNNQLVVKATDYDNTDKPRGKQTWTGEKFGCWYTPTTGIWQSVWMEYAGRTFVERVKLTPDLDTLTAMCDLFLSSNNAVMVQLEAHLTVDGEYRSLGRQQVVCRNGYGRAVICFSDFDVRRDVILWAPEHPNLVDVDITVFDGFQNDEVHTYFGMRNIGTQDGLFMLNGDTYYQRLVLDQGYWKDSLLTPPSDEAIIQDIKLTKELGFNGARKHQKIEDPRYYYWADKLGLLVWGELPSCYDFNDRAVFRASDELSEFIRRDYNHPCIVTWVPLNESWGVRHIQTNVIQQNYARMLLYQIKALDPVRLVSANDGWEQVTETDIFTVHDYSLFPDNTDKYDNMDQEFKSAIQGRMLFAKGNHYRGQPVMMTEYGGIAYSDGNNDSWGYFGKVKNDEEFLARLEPVTSFLLSSRKFSGFCYTQLTDVMQEVNGLLTEERKPKLSIEQLQRIFSKHIF